MTLVRSLPGRRLALLAAGTLLLAACSDTTEPTTPSQINVPGGTTIGGARAGTTQTISVSVLASNGKTLANQPVTFAVTSGGGSVTPTTTNTDANGQATAVWTFGGALGSQLLTVTAGSVTQTITATVAAGLPASVAVSQGANNQTAAAGTAVGTAPSVVVRDAAGNPVQGVQVTFTSLPGGSVTPLSVTTDASGVARVTSWTLGPQTGTYTLQATVLGANVTGNPLSITATATAGAAARIQPSNGVATSGTAGAALSTGLPSVVVTDANGNPVPNVPVTFAVTTGGGTLSSATATTNAQGVATVGGFTLGRTAGANTVTATTQGAGTTTFTITGNAGAPAQTTIVSGNNQSVQAGQPLQVGPSVRVVDQYGNPVSGASVQFVITGGGGSVLQGTQLTNAQGVATVGGWTLGVTPGANTLVARVSGAPDVTFTATGLAGAPATLQKVSGDSSSVVAFRTSQPLVVRVLDAAGFPVANTTVNFVINETGTGTLSATSAQTDAQGRASVTFTANSLLGLHTVTASAASLTPYTFVITTVPNSVASVTPLAPLTQFATAGGPVASPPSVQVKDASGNPVAGVTVFFGPYTNSGSVQAGTVQTDANGVATAGAWTLSATPGTNTLAAITSVPASVPNSTIIFTATGITVPADAALTVVSGVTPTTAPAGSSVPVAVQVKTAQGSPIVGATVQFQVTIGGGNIGGQVIYTAVTDASGIARVPAWKLGTDAATLNSVTASVVGTGAVLAVQVTTQ